MRLSYDVAAIQIGTPSDMFSADDYRLSIRFDAVGLRGERLARVEAALRDEGGAG